jgi:membrane associated rhomboid family serine protease
MLEEVNRYFRTGSVITRLILINVGVFVIQSIVLLVFTLSGHQQTFMQALEYLYFPATLNHFITQPWSIISYQFLHEPLGVLHILFNMLYLYWFGRILLDFMASKYVVPIYITGGIAGALLFMLLYGISPALQTNGLLLGASASILAIVTAAATLVPDYTVHLILIGPVRLKWIALIAVLIDIVGVSSGGNVGGHIAHLGGALTGFLFIHSYRRGLHWFDWVFALGERLNFKSRKKPRVVYVRNEPRTTSGSGMKRNEDQQTRMDAILDKISRSGYDSLSNEERAFLFKISKDK